MFYEQPYGVNPIRENNRLIDVNRAASLSSQKRSHHTSRSDHQLERRTAELRLQEAIQAADRHQQEQDLRSQQLEDYIERLRLDVEAADRPESRYFTTTSSNGSTADRIYNENDGINDAREPLPRRRNGPAGPRANQADSWINGERGFNRAPHPSHQGPMPWMTSLLPQLEFSKYDGDPRRWSEFIGSFKSLVHDVIPTNAPRMGILRQMISPETRKSLGNILNDPNLYEQALYQLKKRYGDPYKISRAHL